MAQSVSRQERTSEKQMLPSVDEGTMRVTVDSTWGEVQPMTLHPLVETVGELEVISHIKAGGMLVDTRKPEFVKESGTLPTARSLEWERISELTGELPPEGKVVLFCNGPQCPASPRAVERLLADGVAAERLAYYRGGIHDWVTLGYPLQSEAEGA